MWTEMMSLLLVEPVDSLMSMLQIERNEMNLLQVMKTVDLVRSLLLQVTEILPQHCRHWNSKQPLGLNIMLICDNSVNAKLPIINIVLMYRPASSIFNTAIYINNHIIYKKKHSMLIIYKTRVASECNNNVKCVYADC